MTPPFERQPDWKRSEPHYGRPWWQVGRRTKSAVAGLVGALGLCGCTGPYESGYPWLDNPGDREAIADSIDRVLGHRWTAAQRISTRPLPRRAIAVESILASELEAPVKDAQGRPLLFVWIDEVQLLLVVGRGFSSELWDGDEVILAEELQFVHGASGFVRGPGGHPP